MFITLKCHSKDENLLKVIQVLSSDSWSEALTLISNVTGLKVHDGILFTYKDDDGDVISGSSELEWSSMVEFGKYKQLTVDIYGDLKEQFGPSNVHVNDAQVSGATCVQSKAAEYGTQCKPCCKPSNNCCSSTDEFCRPLTDLTLKEDDGIPPVKIVNPTLDKFKYTEESLRAVALPLGPLGGGNLSICGDGGLRQWQLSNKVSHTASVPDSFFAIKVEDKSFVLQSNKLYDSSGFKPAPYVTDHVVPKSSIDLLKTVPGVSDVEITAKYPIVEVDYKDKLLKVGVHLEAWSPKIPANSKDSAIPVVLFEYHVTNTTDTNAKISMLGSLQNIAGWNGHNVITDEVHDSGYGGNVNSLFTNECLYGIDMSNPSLPSNHPFNGHVSMTAMKLEGDDPSTMLQYTTVKSLWDCFTTEGGLPGQGITGCSIDGSTFNGAVNVSRNVKPGDTTVFTFMIGWHFPNRYRDWSLGVTVPNTDVFVGNYYAKLWDSMEKVLLYTSSNVERLRKLTYSFRDAMFSSTLPWELVDSAAGRVSVLNSPSCMWLADGNFYAFEGCNTNNGCCPLNCTHVWNYEMALAMLYPDVERTMREIDLIYEITPSGVIPSRTTCPLELRRQWTLWPNYSTDPASTTICVDGEIGTVLKTYREVLHGASKDWLHKLWPSVKRVMNHWLQVLDEDKNGLIYGAQPNTYDCSTYGYSVLIGCLYLCGLRAAEEMAKLDGDKEFEKICHDRFLLGSVNLDEKCFTNGKWYTQVVDPNHMENLLTDATLIGSLYGQWWSHILNLGYLLPRQHIQSHLIYTYERNYVHSFNFKQAPRTFCDQRDSGWLTGKWEDDKIPKNHLQYTGEAAWSGVIYPFASLLLLEGLQYQGFQVLQACRYLYDGTRRSPWNEIECGDHYTRPMAAFAFFKLAAGNTWTRNLKNDTIAISFKPIINQLDFKGFFSIGSCWGSYRQLNGDEKKVELSVCYGNMTMTSLTFGIQVHDGVSVCKYNGDNTMSPVSFTCVQNGELCSIAFEPATCNLSADESLVIKWTN